MFAWILKEGWTLFHPELFEQAFAASPRCDDVNAYHKEILRFLFHRRLDVPEDMRSDHPNGGVNDAMAAVPFLNGSLFAEHTDDDRLDIPANEYWSADEDKPGLFTIFSRYHWTMDEHRPGESEQTLDPELLSRLFERLITPTQEVSPNRPRASRKAPTTRRRTWPMRWSRTRWLPPFGNRIPARISDAKLLELFGWVDESPPHLSPEEKAKLVHRIRELRIFDPAVGSGEFLFSMLTALKRTLGKLAPDVANPAADIIRHQLAGQRHQPPGGADNPAAAVYRHYRRPTK